MEKPPHNVGALDYSNARRQPRHGAAALWLIAIVSLFVALITGDSVLDEFRHRERTDAYIQYTVSQNWRKQNDHSYVSPPFIGRKFVYRSPFELKAFYACVVFGAIAGFAIGSALRDLFRIPFASRHASPGADECPARRRRVGRGRGNCGFLNGDRGLWIQQVCDGD